MKLTLAESDNRRVLRATLMRANGVLALAAEQAKNGNAKGLAEDIVDAMSAVTRLTERAKRLKK